MKKLGMTALAVLLAGTLTAGAAQISWGDLGTNWMLDSSSAPLAVGNTVNLVYAGANGIAEWGQWDDAGNSLADDVVAFSMTVGTGTKGGTTAGQAYQSNTYTFDVDYTTGDRFYIMFWDSATSQYGVVGLNDGGTTGAATTWDIQATNTTGNDQMYPTGSSTADITPVPEPGTILLGLAGAGALLARRRKSKKA